jgi:hypothetical protein
MRLLGWANEFRSNETRWQRWSPSVPAWCWFLVRIHSTVPSTSLARAWCWESRRLAYADVIVLLICAGGLFGFTAVGANLAIAVPSPPVLLERVLPALT